jgi:hypothetical protein
VDTTTSASGQYDRNYTMVYSAASAGQILSVSWVMTSGGGNVTLNGAALSGSGSSITATAGTPQGTTINTAFGTALQATVKDASNNPISGALVTFTVPTSGASASFTAGSTATTNASGIATASTLTANGQTGSYTVTASVSGVATTAGFSLTNTAQTPASLTATGGTPQSTTVNTAFGTGLQATVKDASNNPISGVTVTFAVPGTGASASFTGGSTVMTNANGIATSPTLTANGTTGSYTVTASVSGLATTANFSLTNTATVVGAGALSGSGTSSSTAVSLTAEGGNDWVHWGDGVLNRKTGVTAQISTYAVVGLGSVQTYNNDPRPLSWTDGSPTASNSNDTNGLYISGIGNGFSITAPASTAAQTLVVHVGGWNSGGTLTARLSDGSAPNFVDAPAQVSASYDRNYTLIYRAGTAAQTLTVSWAMTSGTGNVTLNGAALAGASITATAGTPQSTPVNAGFAAALQATVKDAGNNPMTGVTVTFTVPASGPGASFTGGSTAITNATGVATAPALNANGQAGSYTITASAPGVANLANFNLTNLAGAPASIAATAGTPQTAAINSGFTTALQATVSDAGSNPISGAVVTFTAPSSGAGAAFSGLATATATTNAGGVATAPTLTANGQTGTYLVTASVAGVSTPASFSLTNSLPPIKLVQQAQIDSLIDIPSESVGFASPNTAGNWIGVAIFGGQSSTHTFTVTDTNGNTYQRALTMGQTADNITLGMYYAENIKGGANQIKVVPDTSGYIRIVIVEYSGVATSNSLDVTAAAQGNSVSPNSGTVTTTANGDLLWGASASADSEPFAGPGYTLEELVPASPGTALLTEDQIQTTAGPASASLTLGSAKLWTMGLAAIKKVQ